MAAARSASSKKSPKNGRTASRLSFAKITDTLTVPDLLALQTESFDWLVGNDAWKARIAAAKAAGNDVGPRDARDSTRSSKRSRPIEDLGETMQLSFTSPELEEPKYSIEECKERGKTFAAPLYVNAEFMNHLTGEIKTQTVFMGDFPLMTEKGTFIINGTERVVVSQLVRSPGVYFERTPEKTSDKDIYSARIIPSRGAWLEFEIDKRDQVGVRIDRKRKQSVTVFLKALGLTSEEILAAFPGYESIAGTLEKDAILTKEEALKDIYRKLRPGEQVAAEAARALLDNFYFNPKRYDLAKVGRYKINRKLGLDASLKDSVLVDRRHPRDDQVPRRAARRARRRSPGVRDGKKVDLRLDVDDIDHFGNRRIRAVGELIQNQVRTGLSPHGARRPRAHDHAGHRGDHAADPDQRAPRRRRDQGVLRNVAAVAVHGPEQPARGSDPQAPPLGARPRWSVAVSAPASRFVTSTRRTTAACARSRPRKARTSA